MTDFATQVRHQQTDYIIRSLMDVDFYKFTMAHFIHQFYPDVTVTFQLINRAKNIPIAKIIDEQELREQLDHVRQLRLRRTDLYYLRGMDVYGKNMFGEEFLSFLGHLQLGDYHLERDGDQYKLTFSGTWAQTTFWETIALAIISELYYRSLMRRMNTTEIDIMYGCATNKLYQKLKLISKKTDAKIADFGQRRRHSFLWQQKAVEMCKEVLGNQFVGTSNTWLAFNQDLIPIGTNAHELPMVLTAIADSDLEKKNAQYQVLREWQKMYGSGLLVMLPDTYGSTQFFQDMPEDLKATVAHEWRGQRQDSGDPITETREYIAWLKSAGLTSDEIKKKLNIFSDGLDVDPIIEYWATCENVIGTSFGWGTKLTNDFVGCLDDPGELFRPFSFVCKVVEANGNPAVKLSNNINKATGPAEEIERYKKIFGIAGRGDQSVEV